MSAPLSITWASKRVENIGIVHEFHGSKLVHEWKVPAHVVPSLIEARRKIIAVLIESSSIAKYSHSEQYSSDASDE